MYPIVLLTLSLSATSEFRDGSLLVFENSNKPVARVTGSDITHVAVIFNHSGTRWVYEATPAKARRLSLAEYRRELGEANRSRVTVLEPKAPYSEAQIERMRTHAASQIGRRYSVKGFVRGQESDGIHCAHLVAATLEASGQFQFDEAYAISPGELVARSPVVQIADRTGGQANCDSPILVRAQLDNVVQQWSLVSLGLLRNLDVLPIGELADSIGQVLDCRPGCSNLCRLRVRSSRGAMMKLVIYPAVEPDRLSRIEAAAGSMAVLNVADEAAAVAAVENADAFFGKLTLAMLAASTKLRWVQSPTASLEHYIFPELVQHPCTLTNMRGLFSDVIADHVFGYILCFARNLHTYLRQQMARHWEPIGGEQARTSFSAGPGVVSAMDRAHLHLSDCTLGVVGLGAIGGEIANRASAFGMRVLAVDPVRTDKPENVASLWPLDRLTELLGQSDFVVIAAPHTPRTAGMFDRATIRQMKQSAYLINIGRGVIVKLDDLCDALNAGEIAGAALDVFEQEPLPAEHSLWSFENVLITPHVAACSVHIADRHLEVLLDNIRRFVADEPLRNVADKANWF